MQQYKIQAVEHVSQSKKKEILTPNDADRF